MKKFLVAAGLVFGFLFLFGAPAIASEVGDVVEVAPLPPHDQLGPIVSIDAIGLATLAGIVTPILVGLITKLGASSTTKAIVTIVLTVALAVVNEIVNSGGSFAVYSMAVYAAWQFVVHMATYLGIWKPVGSSDAPPLAEATADFGVG